MPHEKNKSHQNYNHNTLFPGAVFTTKHNGECSVLGRSDDKSRRGYYVVQFKDSGIIKEAYGSHIKTGSVSDEAFPSSEEERKVTDDTKILRCGIYWKWKAFHN
jgi:hypothetical protein